MNTVRCFLISVSFAFVSCADDPRVLIDEGNRDLNTGRLERAHSRFASALEGLPEGESRMRDEARLGLCEALATLDPSRCKTEFLALARERSTSTAAYSSVVSTLVDERHFEEAIAILEFGLTQRPDDPKLRGLVDQVGGLHDAFLANAGQTDEQAAEAKARLRGLGYTGEALPRQRSPR